MQLTVFVDKTNLKAIKSGLDLLCWPAGQTFLSWILWMPISVATIVRCVRCAANFIQWVWRREYYQVDTVKWMWQRVKRIAPSAMAIHHFRPFVWSTEPIHSSDRLTLSIEWVSLILLVFFIRENVLFTVQSVPLEWFIVRSFDVQTVRSAKLKDRKNCW